MSEDMSMFKKMKDKITDEVNSATNKLQSMQIIDQLASSIGQQVLRNDSMPHQRLPDLSEQTALPTNSHFSLIDGSPIGVCEEDDELNTEILPQHQLFNVQSIRPDTKKTPNSKNGSDMSLAHLIERDNQHPVIDINHLSSDIEDDFRETFANDDGEIDLLAEKVTPSTSIPNQDGSLSANRVVIYRTRYRDVVHALRRLNDDHRLDRFQLESDAKRLTDQISALREELDHVKQRMHEANNLAPNVDSEKKGSSSHQSAKQANKLKDLEKLMAKCKESLKAKNAQLKILKNTMTEVEKFREYMNDIKNDLKELKNAHETWTLSIAENKRVMHQEIEEKNVEMDTMKSQLKEANNRLLQHKSNIQNLESRLVSMSAAHQKERESLIKELTNVKNSVIKRLQKEHELHLERTKLDLEKSIESLRSDILTRDEQIIRNGQKQQELEKQNSNLLTDLESYKKKCEDHLAYITELKRDKEKQAEDIEELKRQVVARDQQISDETDVRSENATMKKQNIELYQRVEILTKEVSEFKHTNDELSKKLSEAEAKDIPNGSCSKCDEVEEQLKKEIDRNEQAVFELNTKLDLMTTANTDQEKAINDLKTERDAATASIKLSKIESEEMLKKNESLLQVLQDNDSELQAQQEKINELLSYRQQLDSLKKENASLSSSLEQLKNELGDKGGELSQSEESNSKLKAKLIQVESELDTITTCLDNLKREKETLVVLLESESQKRKETDQHLVVNILAALKNLETPETSPGSDKTFQTDPQHSRISSSEGNLPDPIKLAENLSSLALDRSTAYVTSNQRLQAVLLDNNMMNEEVVRLREELNALSREKTNEVMSSIEEVERLRTENQALIHDQKAYEDHIAILDANIQSLKDQVESSAIQETKAAAETETETVELGQELVRKNLEIESLKRLIDEKEERKKDLLAAEEQPGPTSTEFEYLKNIVYQFLIGREPVTLARVISAIFKFDKDQMEQICRFQETIHQVSS